jgi:hypothetical protein
MRNGPLGAISRCSPAGWGVNIFELWESQAALETLRSSSGPDAEQRPAILTMSVREYDIADVRPVFGKGAE